MQVGIGTNRDFGSIAGYRSIAGRANYEVTKTVTDCSVDRTVGDAPANVCL